MDSDRLPVVNPDPHELAEEFEPPEDEDEDVDVEEDEEEDEEEDWDEEDNYFPVGQNNNSNYRKGV